MAKSLGLENYRLPPAIDPSMARRRGEENHRQLLALRRQWSIGSRPDGHGPMGNGRPVVSTVSKAPIPMGEFVFQLTK